MEPTDSSDVTLILFSINDYDTKIVKVCHELLYFFRLKNLLIIVILSSVKSSLVKKVI